MNNSSLDSFAAFMNGVNPFSPESHFTKNYPEASSESLLSFFVTDCDNLPRKVGETMWKHVSNHVINLSILWSKIEMGKVTASDSYEDPFLFRCMAAEAFDDKKEFEDCEKWIHCDEWKKWKQEWSSSGHVIGMLECKLTHDGDGGYSEQYEVIYIEKSGVSIPPDFEDEETEEVVRTPPTLTHDEYKEILRICAEAPEENPELVKAFRAMKDWQESNKK